MFSDDDVEKAWEAWRRRSEPHVPEKARGDAMRRVMCMTAELLAARGGDDAETIREFIVAQEAPSDFALDALRRLGASVAVLEQQGNADQRRIHEIDQARLRWKHEHAKAHQHISDLEKSLETAREERDSTQEALRDVDKHRNSLLERVKRLEDALRFISRWDIAPGAAGASERDYMRNIAASANLDRWCLDRTCVVCRAGEPCH